MTHQTDDTPGAYNASALDKILDVEQTELGAIRTRQPVTMEDYEKAREELAEMRVITEMAMKFIERVFELRNEQQKREAGR